MFWVYLSTLIVSCWIQFHNNFVWSFCVRPSGCFLDLLTRSGRIKKSDWPPWSWHLTFLNFFFYITLKTSVLQKPTWSQLLPNKGAMMPKLQNNIRANRMWPPVRQSFWQRPAVFWVKSHKRLILSFLDSPSPSFLCHQTKLVKSLSSGPYRLTSICGQSSPRVKIRTFFIDCSQLQI